MYLEHLLPGPARTDEGYRAVVFDMDGVLTDTAGMHARGWKAVFDEVLPELGGTGQAPFDAQTDYRAYLDGRPRPEGVRTFLASRGISVPEGGPGDGAQLLTVHGLAARKQELFAAELTRQGVRAFPDALVLLGALVARGVPTALVTSSSNSAAVLAAAGVGHLFTVRVDGTDAQRLGMPGKPDPAVFLEAARRLEVPPAQAVVIEDSTAGVAAATAGGFGQVIGVDRTGAAHELAAAGAHLVVEDLRAVPLVPLSEDAAPVEHRGSWCGGAVTATTDGWRLVYDRFDPTQEGTREALCTLGNGYWATRGAVPGSTADGTHYPGTYFAGIYNRRTTDLAGHPFETEHLVNAPDWTYLSVRPAQGPLLHPGCPEMIAHHQLLDLRHGVLTRTNRYRDATGRTTRVTSRQLHSLADPHLAALEVTVEAEDWSGELIVESAVNAAVSNRNVIADRQLAGEHWAPVESRELDAETVLYVAATTQSGVTVATAARTRVAPGSAQTGRRLVPGHRLGHEITLVLRPGQPVTLEKTAAVATSRDRAISTPALDVTSKIGETPGFALLLGDQEKAWAELWDRFGISLEAGPAQELALNLHIFHVLQTAAAAGLDLDAGLPARGLHGEGYRGHIFWDEIFVYPMLTLRRPELTRSFLRYRHRRLGAARTAAREAGLAGALFPWQSGSDGREETPRTLFNVRNGQWMPDNSHRQRHVGLAVAYSVWQYYQATADIGFLTDYGAELIIEVARLFSSLAVHDPVEDRFDITAVMGPDEYHDGYPHAPGQGVRNNTYTNVLAAWVLARAGETVELLAGHDCDPLWRRLHLAHEETARWDRISRRLRVPWHADGIISQFEGYEDLEEFDWQAYRARYGNIGRLDLILQAEGDSTNRYKLSKQADVLMLFYLFSAEELRGLFARLGYALPPDLIPRTVHYYLARTSHGSTLSRLAHGWVLARTDRARSWTLFDHALRADLDDTQGGTTREGIHLGAMAGTADMVMRCYGGVETRAEALWLHPVLPEEMAAASFQLRYRGQPISVSLTRHTMAMRLHPCSAAPIRVCAEGLERTLSPGQVWKVPLTAVGPPPPPARKAALPPPWGAEAMTDHHAERFRQITEVLARHGLGFGIGAAGLHRWLPVEHGLLGHEQREEPYTNPEHLRLALEQLGPVFVKFGQVLSTRADLLPEPYREQLSRLQDSAPPVPGPVITELIAGELGHAPSEVFAAFEETPLASASLGQAHAARLADGTEVVVKVRRPEVAAQVQEDLEILQNVAARASRYWEAAADYDVTGIAEEFAVTLRAELDYLAEGRNAERFAANFAGNDDIRIPRVFWETTTSRVLTLERMHGLKISDLAGLEAAGIDRAALASRAAGAVAQMVFRDGFFHADPHPGNLFVEPGGRIALIDFGMVGDIDEHLRARLGALLLALVRQNPRRIATALAQLTTSRHPVNIPALAGDLAPVVALYSGRPLGEIPVGGLIKEVHAVLRRHHLQLPREFSLLLKMLLMAEGVGTMLDPQFQLGEVLRPYAHGLLLERYSPSAIAGRLSQAGTDVLDLTAELPEQLRRVQAMLEAGGPELHLRTAELDPLVDRLESAGHRLGLAILAAAFVRGLGDLAASDPVRRRSWQLPVLSTGLGATGSLGAYLAWSAHRQRRRRP